MKRTTKEIDKMTNMLTNFIIQHSDVKREDADIIAFGVKYGLITLAEILGMVVISSEGISSLSAFLIISSTINQFIFLFSNHIFK